MKKKKKKIHVIWFALLALFAFGAFSATSAFATPEILANGAKIAAGVDLHLELEGELLLSDVSAPAVFDAVCSFIFDGLVETPGTLIFINEILMLDKTLLAASGEGVLNLAGTEVNTGDGIECTEVNNLCTGAVLVVPLNLPWDVDIELTEPPDTYRGDLLEEVSKQPEYYMDCKFTELGGLLLEDVCDGLVEARVENNPMTGDLLAAFEEGFGPNGSCALGGAGSGRILSLTDSEFGDPDDGALITVSN
jgi:hypothetical protein